MAGTQEEDHRERRLLRRQNNTAVTAVNRRATVKKARVCANCGNWIRRVKLNYNGQDMGSAYIHFRRRGMSERRFWYVIDRCYPVPRKIPKEEPQKDS